jgi:hypothetical protein
MSILIKGMEMPKNEPMLVKINPDGSVSTTAKNGYKKYEAVHIPPHGELKDADALLAQHYGRFGAIDEVAREAIKNAPTVIPAEDGEGIRTSKNNIKNY